MKDTTIDLQKTGKASVIKTLVLRAWRERWDEVAFGINIKQVLPRGVSGDVYNLAECIFQQALVGTTANTLMISYLRYSLYSHLISYPAVLRRISKYDHFDRNYCLGTLLELIAEIIDNVYCRNKSEEAVLPSAVISLVSWLFQILAVIIKGYEIDGDITTNQLQIFQQSCSITQKIVNNEFLMALLYIGGAEDDEMCQNLRDKYNIVKSKIANTDLSKKFPDIEKNMQKLAHVDVTHLPMKYVRSEEPEPICYCIQPLLAIEVLLNPSNDTAYYVSELLMIQTLKKYSLPRLIYEIVRAGLISLSNVVEISQDALWGAFTFFKMPHIIKKLYALQRPASEQPIDHLPEVVEAFEMLVNDNLLLDSMDCKCSCNIVEYLLNDWKKHHLVNEAHVKHFAAQREQISAMFCKREVVNQSIINFIIRAEVPLSGVLKTLSTDYNKVQEALLGVLCQVLVGNSFDLILSVATVEGRLKTFVSRLIQCNENSKQVCGEVGKQQKIRSTLFDTSFLMLTFIVQTHGPAVVLSEKGDSFFELWVRECMADRTSPKNPRTILAMCDDNIVDELLLTLRNPESTLKNSNLRWEEVCKNLPGVIHHVLIAWEKEILSSADVKGILENIRRRMFSYSVCAISFLCAYMFSVSEAEYLKPLNMIQQFLSPLSSEELAAQDNLKERFGLTCQIIRKMQSDSLGGPRTRSIVLSQSVVSSTPLIDQFRDVWKTISDHGWLPVNSAQLVETVLYAGGPAWLVRQLVDEILKCKFTQDMMKTMDIAFAILHFDIEGTTEALLEVVIPELVAFGEITEPQSHVLAHLCVYCIVSAIDRRQLPSNIPKKRTRSNDADEAQPSTSAKLRKINQSEGGADTPGSNDFIKDNHLLLGGSAASGVAGTISTDSVNSGGSRDTSLPIKESLQASIQHLFKVFMKFVTTDELSPRVTFVYRVFSLLVECGGERIRPVLKMLPPSFTQNLLKVMVTDDITVGLISRIYDLSLSSGRQNAISDLCLWRTIQLRRYSVKL